MSENSTTIVTGPTVEPVDLQLAKSHLRTNTNHDDALIALYLVSSRRRFEALTGRTLLTTTYALNLSSWPESGVITLTRGPYQSLTSITYYDADNTSQTLTVSTDYEINTRSDPAVVVLKNMPSLSTWKRPRVTVQFVAGYTTASLVPADIKTAILLHATDLYENRNNDAKPITQDRFMSVCNQYRLGIIGDVNGS